MLSRRAWWHLWWRLRPHRREASCRLGSGSLFVAFFRPCLRGRASERIQFLGASRHGRLSWVSCWLGCIDGGPGPCSWWWTSTCGLRHWTCSLRPGWTSRSAELVGIIFRSWRGADSLSLFCSCRVIFGLLGCITQDLICILDCLKLVNELDFMPSIAVRVIEFSCSGSACMSHHRKRSVPSNLNCFLISSESAVVGSSRSL